jgi:hypothetical protein
VSFFWHAFNNSSKYEDMNLMIEFIYCLAYCAQSITDFAHTWLFCSVILFPIAITFYITWWFVHFVDGFFSPIYAHLGIDIFGKHV